MPSKESRFGFAKDKRLRKSWEFDNVFRTGRREKGALVRLYFVRGEEGGAKVAAVVGKKIANAAQRSRGRRVTREALRRILPWMSDGVRLVVSLCENGLEAKATDVYADLTKSLAKRSLLKKSWPGGSWT